MLLRKLTGVFLFLYLNILNISCEEGITIAFAIDDTRSMRYVIEEVKREAKNILDLAIVERSSEIKDFVLVTINDPDSVLRTKTSSTYTLQNALRSISVHNHNNWDCMEMSLSGIETALQESRPNSYIFVFTDATAKDYSLDKLDTIKNWCQKQQSQVIFVLTGDCGETRRKRYRVYYEIAEFCSGQVFRVEENEVHSVLDAIRVLLQRKHTVVKWITIPRTIKFVPVEFTLDEKADYALVSTSGKNVFVKITSTNHIYGPEPEIEKVMWQSNGKVLKLVNPAPGTYYAWVKGDSTFSVVIYARTDFTFDHGFSTNEPKSLRDTTKRPVASKPQHLTINVTDPEHSVDIKSVHILDMQHDDQIIKKLPLRRIGDHLYITDAFVSPSRMFRIAVNGVIKKTGQPITRISKTAIEPMENVPNVEIAEGVALNVNYGASGSLTCKVIAHPKPTIKWSTAGGNTLPSENYVIGESSYGSRLMLEYIKKTETYICKAENNKGIGSSQTQVTVRPVFNLISVPTATTTAIWGKDVKMHCNIKSYLPIKIRWFHQGKELSSTGKNSISADGTELTVTVTDLGIQGIYTCEAFLISEPTVKETHNTNVKITGLEHPVIAPTNKKIKVWKGNKIELNCKIAKGLPEPYVQWYKKNGNNFDVIPHVTGEVLTVPNAVLNHAGEYKCVAENAIGSESAVFEVTVIITLDITIPETQRIFPYGSNVEFTCKVETNPPPTIAWKNDKGTVLQTKVTKVADYEFTNQLKLQSIKKSAIYTCEATNSIGHTTEYVNITVSSPFDVKTQIGGDTQINYGTEKTLRCDIKSSHPMSIQWYLQKTDATSSRTLIQSSDKNTISSDGTELKITFMDLNMVGIYTCEASLKNDPEEKITFDTNVKIVGVMKPVITYHNSVLKGKDFTAICRVKGVPKPTISWQFKQKGSDAFTVIPGSEEELNISHLSLKHSGDYKCVAKNILGSVEHDFNVVVEEPPVITNKITTYFGLEGDLVLSIPCNVTGFPDPEIVWKIEGKSIDKNSQYVTKENVLYIMKPMKKNSNQTTCGAKNKLGTAEKLFYTEVTDTFENDENYYGITHEIYAIQGKPINLKCNIINSETRSVRWYRNGQPEPDHTGNTYIIKSGAVSDDGNYTCRVNTDKGSQSETFALNIGFLRFVNNGPSPKTVEWNDIDEVLDCSVEAKPSATMEWLHDRKKVKNQSYLDKLPVTDWGEYSCNASNKHGSIQKTFKVITSGCFLTMNMGTQNRPLISSVKSPTWPNTLSYVDITLKENEIIKLSCPTDKSSSNAFKTLPSNQEIIAQCQTQDKFIVDGKTYRYSELQCKEKVELLVLNTLEQCSHADTELIRVGFSVNGFLEALTVCYDKSKNVPVYVKGPRLPLKSIGDVDWSKFKWTPAPGLGDGKQSGGYTCKSSNKCCYEKGQLLDVSELPFGPAQDAAFRENLNSIAIWHPCDGSDRTSWKSFINEMSYKSLDYNEWSSWTGASDYASKNGGLVPRYLWKVIRHDGEISIMVYVNSEAPTDSDIRCTQFCEPIIISSQKFLYCCTPEEFSTVFKVDIKKLK